MFIFGVILVLASAICVFCGLKADESKFIFYTVSGICGFFGLLICILTSLVIVDSGEVGVPVLFGKVQNKSLSEGINCKNPFASVKKYPVRLQEYTMSGSANEGDVRGDDSISVKTKDGLSIGLDLTVWWCVDKDKAFSMYREVARNKADILKKIIRPSIRTIIRDVAVKYNMNDLYSKKRDEFVNNLVKEAKTNLLEKYILVDKVLVRNVILPKSVEDAIANKMKIMQESEAMEFEKTKAIKKSQIIEIEARGLATAQRIINSTLTPNYIQHEAIEAYKELAGSQNTTFVIMPTSTKGAGMPLILNATGK